MVKRKTVQNPIFLGGCCDWERAEAEAPKTRSSNWKNFLEPGGVFSPVNFKSFSTKQNALVPAVLPHCRIEIFLLKPEKFLRFFLFKPFFVEVPHTGIKSRWSRLPSSFVEHTDTVTSLILEAYHVASAEVAKDWAFNQYIIYMYV